MLSKEEVQHIAKLARLELSPDEVSKMQKDLSAILAYFDLLKKAPKPKSTSTRPGLVDALSIDQVTRKDRVQEKPASIANNLIAVAPHQKDGYIKVKNVF